MKHIQKNTEPAAFIQWKEQQRSVGVNCNYCSLQNPQKRDVHEALLQEQGHICCYCCGRIEVSTSHIEHFDPQSEHEEERSVDYDNLLASCGRTAPYPKHCGNQKGNAKIEISPLQPVCEQCFTYKSNGRIAAVNVHPLRQKAEVAIDTLNLNHADLVQSRFEAFEVLQDLSEIEVAQFIQGCLQRDPEGKFVPFGVAVLDQIKQFYSLP